MSIFKIEPLAKVHDLSDKLLYITNPEASKINETLAAYVSTRHAYDEMMLIKKCYLSDQNNTLNGRQFYDYELSVTSEESGRFNEFSSCVQECVNYLANFGDHCFQTIASIHTNTDNLHAHILCNNTDMETGERFNISKADLYQMREAISDILVKHDFEPVKDRD